MAGYTPLHITKMEAGLVQQREEFILPNDAYPTLLNAYVWRERILRKKGFELLGRLQRNIGTTDGAGNAIINITPLPIQTGIASFVIGTDVFVDPGTTANPGTQTLLTNSSGSGTLNRTTGVLTITGSQHSTAIQYFPGLPVMGIWKWEQPNSALDRTVFFDQDYAYQYNSVSGQFQEFIPGTTWNARAANVYATDFFFSTNYWISGQAFSPFGTAGQKLMWVTNNTGSAGATSDPPRITDGTTWVDFTLLYNGGTNLGGWNQIDATNFLFNFLSMLPYRGRMVTFNTWEGTTAASAQNYSNRIRWSTIGNPFIPYRNPGDGFLPAVTASTGSWRDDIRGQGGFLDIPTSEDIVAVGFVRDNLVIYCERSTWQLRYTGQSISPFQMERVNSELGVESPFSAVQFDTSLVGIGDKGIVECDSYQSRRIDIKIPDFVFSLNEANNGTFRVQGIRDFVNRLAYWTVPITSYYDPTIPTTNQAFPNQRLVYNYENDSWALFTDSLTTLGNYQPQNDRTWLTTLIPWIQCEFPWIDTELGNPIIVGGNQQGFVLLLDQLTVNDNSLFITNITGNDTATTVITSPNHNLRSGDVIQITGITAATDFANLNNGIFGVQVGDNNENNGTNMFRIFKYDSHSGDFDTDQLDSSAKVYKGGGLIKIRENFIIQSKKFNYMDEGQSIQFGYLDILMVSSGGGNPGEISFNMYLDYDDIEASNISPENTTQDTFFNSIIPTTQSSDSGVRGTKFWQRVFCPTRANFLTLVYTFSNAQLNSVAQQLQVQIDAQVLWIRKGGRMTQP